jgi:phosphoribosylanthranilate isomerase
MTFVKFCGMTRPDDVRLACALGVNALGFVMWPRSPRYVNAARVAELVTAMRPDVTPVGVLVAPSQDEIEAARTAGVRVLQIHGNPSSVPDGDVWLARSVDDDVDGVAPQLTIVLDAHDPERHGGTGQTIDWQRAAVIAARRRVLLAGGLTPDNVGRAIRQVRPHGVDVASGIEERPGIKSARAMTAFVTAVREASE